MPSVNTLITALVAGLTIGAQAGPCRPHAPYSSVTQVATMEHTQPSTKTSAAYINAVTRSETELPETTLSTSTIQVTSSTEAEFKPTTTDEEDTPTTGYTSAESTPTNQETTQSVPSTTSGSLTIESTTESTSTTEETTTSLPSTTLKTEDTTTSVPSTTSSEPKTTLDTTTLPPTTTSSEAATTTSQASTTTSEASTPSCTCNKTGEITAGEGHLLDYYPGYTQEQCQAECEKNKDCKVIGLTTGSQCELYDTSLSVLAFEPKDGWYYSVWDACCFKEE
ncbi:hypothetical protein NW762_011872 [Fusarium torreyae]|uniref:Apple domain-containing protein n=1 Tax=Fusarium torreyae TaxID=1237075 RepID=A0A9W8RR98_9HYPO|nr:hypothetical protein NW762_011872 [Fusarium torreyae]